MAANPTPPSSGPASWTSAMRSVARYSHLGWTLAFSIVGGVFAGRWADAKWDTEPWLLLLGSFLGISVGLYHFMKSVLYAPPDKPTGEPTDEEVEEAPPSP